MLQPDPALPLPLAWQHYLGHQPKLEEYDTCYIAAYTVAFSGAGYVRQELTVTVGAGVERRVDGVMGRVE